MCGRYNLLDSPVLLEIMDVLGVKLKPEPRLDISPGANGEFVIERNGSRELVSGVWSLLIEPKPDGSGYRPSPKFSTFNARSDKLNSSRLWKKRYRSQRAIIPASGFHEWTGEPGHKQPHSIRPVHGAIAFAALYEFWEFGGDLVPSYTMITLPPHPRFEHIHKKSIPLMLTKDDFDPWLDPDLHDIDAFQGIMSTHIPVDLIIEPIRSTRDLEPVGEVEVIPAD